jgi:hypothetical protein
MAMSAGAPSLTNRSQDRVVENRVATSGIEPSGATREVQSIQEGYLHKQLSFTRMV